MGQMGFGYGSEYQLMRFMGRHRNKFDNEVKKVTGMNGVIEWFDFKRSGLLDREILNMDFISDRKIRSEWNEVWPTRSNRSGINWDAIGKIGDTFLLVEAKAHEKEMYQPMKATNIKSIEKIKSSFNSLSKKYNIEFNDKWLFKNYQLMNRFVALDFLHSKGMKAILLNVYFINGYEIDAVGKPISDVKSVLTLEKWTEITSDVYSDLKLTDSKIKKHIYDLFIQC